MAKGFGFQAKLLGSRQLIRAFKKSAVDIKPQLHYTMEAVVRKLEGTAKKQAPVDSGFLKGNIEGKVVKVTTERVEGEVGTWKSVKYAYWVHEGHMAWGRFYVPPNRFLLRAYYIERRWVHDAFKDAIFKDFMNTLAKNATLRTGNLGI